MLDAGTQNTLKAEPWPSGAICVHASVLKRQHWRGPDGKSGLASGAETGTSTNLFFKKYRAKETPGKSCFGLLSFCFSQHADAVGQIVEVKGFGHILPLTCRAWPYHTQHWYLAHLYKTLTVKRNDCSVAFIPINYTAAIRAEKW